MTARTAALIVAVAMTCTAGADVQAVRELLQRAPVTATAHAGEVAIYVPNLDLLASDAHELVVEVALLHAGGEDRHSIDLLAPWQTPAVVLRTRPGAAYREARIAIRADGEVAGEFAFDLTREAAPAEGPPLTGEVAYIEPGMAMDEPPRIELPQMSALRTVALSEAAREVALEALSAQVRTDVNYPLVSASNNCAVSLSTAHPGDPARRSLYVPMKSQLFDPDSGAPQGNAHYLVEVPLDAAWLEGDGDLQVALPAERIAVHTADARWSGEGGTPILGSGDTGLGQLVGTVDVDAEGRIYYASVPSGVARFDPRAARWEVPSLDFRAHFDRLLPAVEDLPAEYRQGEVRRGFYSYAVIGVHAGRLFYAPIIQAVYPREEQTTFIFAGLMSLPLDGWDDAQAFAEGLRFHVGSWPGCERTFWEGWADPADSTRKLGRLFSRDDGLYVTAYLSGWGGPWRLQIDEDGQTVRFGPVQSVPRGEVSGPRTAASGLADWSGYGAVTMTRAALEALLTGSSSGGLSGDVAVYYDAIAAMRLDAARYGPLLEALEGPSLAPAYMAVAMPGRSDAVLGVAEYGYYLAQFDLTRLDEGVVEKRYLLEDIGASDLELPLRVGLGPYGHTWWREADAQYLYVGGYTGLTRLVMSRPDLTPGRHRMEPFLFDLQTEALDGAGAGGIKRFRYLQPGLDRRIFLTGTHSAARAGTAFSGGLMCFDPADRTVLQKISGMSRCYWTLPLHNRVVHGPEGRAEQQFVLGGGRFDEAYAFELPPEQVPANHDPRLFLYDCAEGEAPRSLFGFALPPESEGGGYLCHAFDRSRRYLLVLQGASLLSFDLSARRFVDGLTMAAPAGADGEGPLTVAEFARPDVRLLRAPDDSLMLYVSARESATSATFQRVEVAEDGAISLTPHLTVRAQSAETLASSFGVVAAFVPDSADGSVDLVLGAQMRSPATTIRVIRDFIAPRR